MRNMITEEWKDVENYEGYYQVSNTGKIKSLPRPIPSRGGVRVTREKLIKTYVNNSGYYTVALHKEGKQERFLVHRLVAKAFVHNPDNKPTVNHKNHVRSDNRAENLEWVTMKEQCDTIQRINSRNSHINRQDVSKKVQCVETGEIYPSTVEVYRQTGIPHQSVQACCKGRKYYNTAGGYHWKYVA